MTDHEATAKALLPCVLPHRPDDSPDHPIGCPAYYRPAVAAALAEASTGRHCTPERPPCDLVSGLYYQVFNYQTEIAQLRAKLVELNNILINDQAERDAAEANIFKSVRRAISLHTCDVNGICMCMVHILKDVDAIAAEIAKAGKPLTVTLEQFATDYPCHCAENYPGTTKYHGHDCENEVVQEFVAQWQSKAGKVN